MSFFSGKKIFLLGFILVLLVAIPLTVYFVQQQQEVRTRAQKSTTLSFTPSSASTTVGKTVSLDISMNPGQNQVSFAKLHITYDASKLATSSSGASCGDAICPNSSAFPSVLEGPVYSDGSINITLSVGADPTKVVQTTTKVATVTFEALSQTDQAATQVLFGNQTQVLSAAAADQASENVLSTTNPALITIGAGIAPTTAATTPTPTTRIGAQTTPGPNKPPICTSLTVDRAATGSAPFSIAFTANGNDPDGTIQKVTFNFGDGPVQDVLQAGGIGTNSVSVQISHTYNNPGTFQASAVLTDSGGATSNPTACTQTIAVAAATPTVPVGGQAPTNSPTPTPTIIPGPGDTLIGIGALGLILTVVGGLLFFAL